MTIRALGLLLLACPSAVVSNQDPAAPPILETLELPAERQAVAVSADGRRAAVALPAGRGDRSPRTLLSLHSLDAPEPATIKISGLVRDLLFSDDDASIYALEHRPAKRLEGESYLLRIGLSDWKVEERLRLPPTARAIEPWRAGGSLLIPARDEIRTITLPSLRSGPLYRVPGQNLSLFVSGGSRVLVGQDTGLVVVDLSDPQGREGMPVRERIATPAPVLSIDLDDGGIHAVAHLADGSDVSVNLVSRAPVESEPAVTREIPPAQERPVPTRPQVPAPASVPLVPAAPAPAEVEPAVVSERGQAQVRGTIHDAAADLVIRVVFLGPDNLLREAARVQPGSDGRWEISGLSAGRYRVQLDAGGARALITEPPFRTLEIGDAPGAVLGADFRVAGTL